MNGVSIAVVRFPITGDGESCFALAVVWKVIRSRGRSVKYVSGWTRLTVTTDSKRET